MVLCMIAFWWIIGNIALITILYYRREPAMTTNERKYHTCGRVHLGPVVEMLIGKLKCQRCESCNRIINETEQLAYWKTKRAAISCRAQALLHTRTR